MMKHFCDVCEKEITNLSNGKNSIEFNRDSSNHIEFELCGPCRDRFVGLMQTIADENKLATNMRYITSPKRFMT